MNECRSYTVYSTMGKVKNTSISCMYIKLYLFIYVICLSSLIFIDAFVCLFVCLYRAYIWKIHDETFMQTSERMNKTSVFIEADIKLYLLNKSYLLMQLFVCLFIYVCTIVCLFMHVRTIYTHYTGPIVRIQYDKTNIQVKSWIQKQIPKNNNNK